MKGKKVLQELKLIFYKLETKSSNMYTVFQPLSDTRVFIYLFIYLCHLFLPSSTSKQRQGLYIWPGE